MIGLDVSIYPKVQIVTSGGVSQDEVFAFIYYGQSESIGSWATPVDNSIAKPPNARTINGQPRTHLDILPSNINNAIDVTALTSNLTPTENEHDNLGQTATSAFLSNFAASVANICNFECLGKGGESIQNLTTPDAPFTAPPYTNFYNIGATLHAIAEQTGKTVRPVLIFYHGARNAADGMDAATYKAYLKKLRRDIQAQVNGFRDDGYVLPMYLTQFTHFHYGSTPDEIARAQYEAAHEDENIKLLETVYWLTYYDNVHPDTAGQNAIGDQLATMIKGGIGGLFPVSITHSGGVVTVKYDRPLTINGANVENIQTDIGAVTNATVTGDSITFPSGIPPARVKLCWNTASTGTGGNKTNVTGPDGEHALAFDLPVPWSRPTPIPDPVISYPSLTPEESGFAKNATIWLEADSAFIDNANNRVLDKAGKAGYIDGYTSTGAGLPALVTAGGYDYFDFTGTQWLQPTAQAWPMGSQTVCVVCEETGGGSQIVVSPYNGTQQTSGVSFNGNRINFGSTYNNTGFVNKTAGFSVFVCTWHQTTNRFRIRQNGVEIFNGIGPNALQPIYMPIPRFGAYGRDDANQKPQLYFTGKVAHISLHQFDANLTGNIATLENYLMAKYLN